jgi:hypothetical protein
MNRNALAACIALLCTAGCGVYTFSGSTLPGHLKTVDIPLFVNQSLQPEVAERITEELTKAVLSANLLRIVSADGDATIAGTVRRYENEEYTFDIKQARSADVEEYVVRIVIDVAFVDNKKDEALYKGVITAEGIYSAATESEEDGQRRAVQDAVERILQNSVQSW